MTYRTLCVHCIDKVQVVIIGCRYFPHIFLVENWLFIFFKNNTYSEKNSANKDMFKVNKRLARTRCELFSNLSSKKNIRTMSHSTPCPSVSITDFDFCWTKCQTGKENCCCFISGLKNVNCFCQFLIKFWLFRTKLWCNRY